MGCRLVRGETIYFVRHGGPTHSGIELEWLGQEKDSRLLPRVYTHSDGRHGEYQFLSPVIPIEVQCFEHS